MIFVKYFDKDSITGELIPACGDHVVAQLDGRGNVETWKEDAVMFNGVNRPIYKAFQIFIYRNFNDCKALTEIISL